MLLTTVLNPLKLLNYFQDFDHRKGFGNLLRH